MIEDKEFDNGFQYIEIRNASARAKVALQGAHLFHYEAVAERPLLWLSEASFFEAGKAIRGGIPVCWPWFGKHPDNSELPQHGFARSSVWKLLETTEVNEYTTEVILRLRSSDESLQLWPYQFELFLAITVGQTLTVALTTQNCDTQAFEITAALHSYFAVENVEKMSVEGLAGKSYLDLVTGEEYIQQGHVTVSGEVDRIYREVGYPVVLHDQTRTLYIDAQGSRSAIVWNPWKEKCIAMADMNDEAYKTMLCIETANAAGDARMLAPGEEHTLKAVISFSQNALAVS